MDNKPISLPAVSADDPDCPEKCREALAGSTKAQIIEALISSGCSAGDPAQYQGKLLKGLIAELCGCHCSGHFPFADPVEGSGELSKPEATKLPPWAVKLLKSRG